MGHIAQQWLKSGLPVAPRADSPVAVSKDRLGRWTPGEETPEDHPAGEHSLQSPRKTGKSHGPLHCFVSAKLPLPPSFPQPGQFQVLPNSAPGNSEN